jgi:hypothetical protein
MWRVKRRAHREAAVRVATRRASAVAAASALILALVGTLGGCATRLRPAPGAWVLPGPGHAAIAEASGVRIVVGADAWRGDPDSLTQVVTPMLVRIENNGDVPVQVRYPDFALLGEDGRRFIAIPPFDVRGAVWTTQPPPPYLPYGPGGWPWYSSAYPPIGFYPFGYYDVYWPYWHRWVTLPTGDMVQKALPEGTVQPRSASTGFLYFEDVKKTPRVTFEARLPVPDTPDRRITLTIPFVSD